ncbi:MAG: N-acetyltransferase [Candidatus Omnitrophica bacterium]|nr:N-acetyltransferase [Candidatus Omnitrophota bacterium]
MLRKATLKDAKKIQKLIHFWAKKGRVLNRPLNYIYENIRDFWIYQENRKVLGVCALHVVGWDDLAEVKSLVVDEGAHKRGVGRKLVAACIKEAAQLGVKNLFALTYVEVFFKKMGFKKISKSKLPHKIWNECINCVDFPNQCSEIALLLKIK